MSGEETLVSKVLVLDSDRACIDAIKSFCDDYHLVGVRARPETAFSVLSSNVDLGAVFLSENYNDSPTGGHDMATLIHNVRPELPVFLRKDEATEIKDMIQYERNTIAVTYSIGDIGGLSLYLDRYIFSLKYPNALIRGITDISTAALESQFKNVRIEMSPPYVVRDRLIFGEIFTLIPIESSWCRGYMMFQTPETDLLSLVRGHHTYIPESEAGDFRSLNSLLGEITNLVWGAFKNRYVGDEKLPMHLSQVPIIVNHTHRYISFGSENPQLCFKYTITDTRNPGARAVVLFQKFVFNLSFSPEDFSEVQTSVEDLVESGELDWF